MKPLGDLVQTITEPLIVAHRGASGTAPENTIAAIKQALEFGVQMVEIDVQLSRDQQIVVCHDPTLERTTDSTGDVALHNAEQLQKLDAGSWFSSEFKGQRIPLLEEVFTLLQGKVYINIEIKPPSIHEDYQQRIDLIIAATLAAGFAPFTLFSSFHHDSLRYLQSLPEHFYTAAIIVPGDSRLSSEIVADVGCEVVVLSLDQLSPVMVQDIQQNNLFTGVYPINTETELKRAMAAQVKGIVTDFPGLMLEKVNR